MNALPEKARDDLQKILGLLESTHEGERDAAVRAATRLLDRHGLRWCEILAATSVTVIRRQDEASREPPRRDPADPFGGRGWRDVAIDCQRFPHLINQWEQDFLSGLPRFSRLSGKQTQVLVKMVRLRACGCRV
jgi:hypothetical protein